MHYLDYAATAPVRPEVTEAMLIHLTKAWGNPSSIYSLGREARKGIDEAREKLARAVGSSPEEIVFTGSGTEAGNLAVKGIANVHKNGHILVSAIEHHAILDSAKSLAKQGFEIEMLPVDKLGVVTAESVEQRLRADTILVCVMLANNEIGTIQPLQEIAMVCNAQGVTTFTDAVQAFGKVFVDVKDLGVDLAAFSAHKIGGAKGTGALYVRRGIKLDPVTHGGGQERGRRSGTENVAGIAGFGVAAELVTHELESEPQRWLQLRTELQERLLSIEGVRLNGHPKNRLPHNLHISIKKVTGSDVLLMLDGKGICASTGSACQSGSAEPSYVLAACGVQRAWAEGALRFTVGRDTTRQDIDAAADALEPIIERLRQFA